jgi:general secretion pathway protein D
VAAVVVVLPKAVHPAEPQVAVAAAPSRITASPPTATMAPPEQTSADLPAAAAALAARLGDPNVSSAPESVLVGRTLLVADNITNSIVVQGPPSGLEIIERLLDQIDVKPDQVMISTIIGQLTADDSREFGVDYLLNGTDAVIGGGGNIGTILTPLVPAPGSFPEFDRSSIGGSGLRAIGTIGDLGVYLRALQTKTDFTVLSRPSIFTSNNQKGTISSGERIAIPTGSNSFGAGVNGTVSTQIEYQDVVLRLEVIPLVNSDNEITMQIALLNDEVGPTTPIEGIGDVPSIITREILTTATVPTGQTIVLGGLITKSDRQSNTGIPILSDIPLLGKLFGSNVNNERRSELMVFIQPSIVKNDRSLQNVQADMDSRHIVSGPARTFADGPGVLPPVEAITPVADKSGSAPRAKVVSQPQAAPVKKKQLSFGKPYRN